MSRSAWLSSLPLALSLLSPNASAQQEKAVFNTPSIVLGADDPPFRRLLDVDGDGDLDAVGMMVAKRNDQFRLNVYKNTGTGAFLSWAGYTSQQSSASSTSPLIETADLDGTGKDNFVVAALDKVYVFSLPTFSISLDATHTLPSPAQALVLGELNGDGLADILVATTSTLEAILSNGSTVSIPRDASLGPIHTLRIGDIDSDGFADILFATKNNFQVLFGAPGGALQTGPLYAPPILNAKVDLGDVNGDGFLDVALFGSPTDGTHVVYFGNGARGFIAGTRNVGGPAEFLRDVDGDGDLDGVCCGGGSCGSCPTYEQNVEPSDFEVSINDGDGNFAPSFVLHGIGSPQLAGAQDLDGDGDVDLIAGRAIYYARGPITNPNPVSSSPLPDRPSMRDVADFDGDGDPDLGFSLGLCLVNDGTGSFQGVALQIASAPAGTRFLGPGYPGDFDGDGDVDLLVEHRRLTPGFTPGSTAPAPSSPTHASYGGGGSILGMRLLANDGAGHLYDGGPASAPGTTFSLGSLRARDSVAADLNGDGALDLITVGTDARSESRVWLNDGMGVLLGPIRLTGYWVAHVTDLDKDGVLDLMVATPSTYLFTSSTDKMEVLRGTLRPGGLVSYQLIPGLTEVSGVWHFPAASRSGLGFGDLYGAGFTDMVLMRMGFFGPIALWDRQAIGGWGFSGQANLDTASVLSQDAGAMIGDVTGDGLNDALIGPWGGGELVEIHDLMRKLTPLGFGFSYDAAQVLPHGILLDVDGDGDLDLVGKEVILNRTVR